MLIYSMMLHDALEVPRNTRRQEEENGRRIPGAARLLPAVSAIRCWKRHFAWARRRMPIGLRAAAEKEIFMTH